MNRSGNLLLPGRDDGGKEESPTQSHIELKEISKRFGGVEALRAIDLKVERGSVHGLVGENGAGKSTLGKIISGVLQPDTGAILVDGRQRHYSKPHDALADGITMIQQETALVPRRRVDENVLLGIESTRFGWFVRNKHTRQRFDELNARSGFNLPAATLVADLGVAEQKKVEILKAVARDARLIVMDEPTAALTADETERLLKIVQSLRDSGTTIIYITHFLEEVLSIADTVTILRNGEVIRTSPTTQETPDSLVMAMLGRSASLTFPAKTFPQPDAPVVVSARNFSRRGGIQDISFDIRAGEIVGLAGLVGSGRSELARTLFGAKDWDSGEMEIDGQAVEVNSPRDAIEAGIGLLPESRKLQGLIMQLPTGHNVSLPHLDSVSRGIFVQESDEYHRTASLLTSLDVRPAKPEVRVGSLSGGNQQKVLFAKWLFRRPRFLIADEPAHGVDVGAKRALYQLITALAEEGMAVLLISSELEEIMGLAHRVLVMRLGRIVVELTDAPERPSGLSEDAIMRAAFGQHNTS